MKQTIVMSLAAIIVSAIIFALPVLIAGGQAPISETAVYKAETSSAAPSATPFKPLYIDEARLEAETLAAGYDKNTLVKLLVGDQVKELPMSAYLVGVVLAEVPASFEMEALRAQAVAARTHTVRYMSAGKHEQADVCSDSSCCKAYLDSKQAEEKLGSAFDTYVGRIEEAVSSTDGLIIAYEGKAIDAAFFSCSNGYTEDAVDVWGAEVPYLQSVESPGEENAPRYSESAEFSLSEFKSLIRSAYKDANFTDDPEDWIGAESRSDAGGVISLDIGGVTIPGTEIRGLFSLRSTDFTLDISGDSVSFHTRGHGHRVGMSQYGANAMAKAGSDYEEILLWYYKDTEIVKLSPEKKFQ